MGHGFRCMSQKSVSGAGWCICTCTHRDCFLTCSCCARKHERQQEATAIWGWHGGGVRCRAVAGGKSAGPQQQQYQASVRKLAGYLMVSR